jgi:hypothetical protein
VTTELSGQIDIRRGDGTGGGGGGPGTTVMLTVPVDMTDEA